MIQEPGVAFPLSVRAHVAHSAPHLQAVVFELNDLNTSVDQIADHFPNWSLEEAQFTSKLSQNAKYKANKLPQSILSHNLIDNITYWE